MCITSTIDDERFNRYHHKVHSSDWHDSNECSNHDLHASFVWHHSIFVQLIVTQNWPNEATYGIWVIGRHRKWAKSRLLLLQNRRQCSNVYILFAILYMHYYSSETSRHYWTNCLVSPQRRLCDIASWTLIILSATPATIFNLTSFDTANI